MAEEEAVVEGGGEVGTEVDIRTTRVLHSRTINHHIIYDPCGAYIMDMIYHLPYQYSSSSVAENDGYNGGYSNSGGYNGGYPNSGGYNGGYSGGYSNSGGYGGGYSNWGRGGSRGGWGGGYRGMFFYNPRTIQSIFGNVLKVIEVCI